MINNDYFSKLYDDAFDPTPHLKDFVEGNNAYWRDSNPDTSIEFNPARAKDYFSSLMNKYAFSPEALDYNVNKLTGVNQDDRMAPVNPSNPSFKSSSISGTKGFTNPKYVPQAANILPVTQSDLSQSSTANVEDIPNHRLVGQAIINDIIENNRQPASASSSRLPNSNTEREEAAAKATVGVDALNSTRQVAAPYSSGQKAPVNQIVRKPVSPRQTATPKSPLQPTPHPYDNFPEQTIRREVYDQTNRRMGLTSPEAQRKMQNYNRDRYNQGKLQVDMQNRFGYQDMSPEAYRRMEMERMGLGNALAKQKRPTNQSQSQQWHSDMKGKQLPMRDMRDQIYTSRVTGREVPNYPVVDDMSMRRAELANNQAKQVNSIGQFNKPQSDNNQTSSTQVANNGNVNNPKMLNKPKANKASNGFWE